MFGQMADIGKAMAIASKAQDALKTLKALDEDHDGKADLEEIITEAVALAPLLIQFSEQAKTAVAPLLEKGHEVQFSEVVNLLQVEAPLAAEISGRVQKIMSLAQLDLAAIGKTYDLDLKGLLH